MWVKQNQAINDNVGAAAASLITTSTLAAAVSKTAEPQASADDDYAKSDWKLVFHSYECETGKVNSIHLCLT